MFRNHEGEEPEAYFTDKQWHAIVWRDRLLALGGFVLALAIGAIAWYGYPRLRGESEAINQIKNVQTQIDGIGGQIKAADAKVDAKVDGWEHDRQDLRDQMQKLGQRLTARMESASKRAEQASADMFRQAQARMDDQMRGVEARMSRVESSSANANTQIAELQRQLGQVRGELAQQASEIRSVRQDMRNDTTMQQVAELKNSEERDRKDVNSIIDSLDVRRVAFEVRKNQNVEVAPGVSLKLTSIDTTFHRVNGWMFLMPDRRTLWLHGQSVQEPVTFYGDKDGKKRELVLTSVSKSGATGYVLLPKEEGSKEVAGLRQ